MKHLHLLMVALTLGLFFYQASWVFAGRHIRLSRRFFGISHAIYLLLVGSGLALLWQLWQVAGVQPWALAKIVLLVVAVSANIKALRQDMTLAQKRAGVVIAAICYVAIVCLAIGKPML